MSASSMRNALQDAGIAQYKPTRHAIDRARLRFGIPAERVSSWINDIMRNAKRIGESGAKGVEYLAEGVRVVVDETSGLVITLHAELKTDFLRPTLERELRKLKRLYTRSKRALELEYAEAMRELADMAINRARARNPQTRALIGGRMADKQTEIDEFVRSIEWLDDEYSAKKRAIELIAE